jgi:hypothetical protein
VNNILQPFFEEITEEAFLFLQSNAQAHNTKNSVMALQTHESIMHKGQQQHASVWYVYLKRLEELFRLTM